MSFRAHHPIERARSRLPGVVVALALAAVAVARAGQAGDEPDPRLTAAELLPAIPHTGEGYAIAAEVRTPGHYHLVTITSDFGRFDAEGLSQVEVRLEEIAALQRLEALSRAGVFARAAGESLVKVGTGVVDAVTDPVATARGIGSGVKRLGVNLGRRTRRAVQRLTDDEPGGKDGDGGSKVGEAAAGAGKSLIGLNGARRRWARRVGADPYTTNPVLKDALERVAAVDVAGGIVTAIALPIPPLVGTTAKVGDLVWGTDPEELRKLNEARAREIGTSADAAAAFFRNRAFTLTLQTRMVAALHGVGVPGTGDYLASAADADDAREALFFVESAEMLLEAHEASPVTAVLTDSRALVARRASGEAVALLPLDWIRDAAASMAEFDELARRATRELGASSLQLQVSGTVTPRAAAALAAMGWRR